MGAYVWRMMDVLKLLAASTLVLVQYNECQTSQNLALFPGHQSSQGDIENNEADANREHQPIPLPVGPPGNCECSKHVSLSPRHGM